jgi:hypothetical protein
MEPDGLIGEVSRNEFHGDVELMVAYFQSYIGFVKTTLN